MNVPLFFGVSFTAVSMGIGIVACLEQNDMSGPRYNGGATDGLSHLADLTMEDGMIYGSLWAAWLVCVKIGLYCITGDEE